MVVEFSSVFQRGYIYIFLLTSGKNRGGGGRESTQRLLEGRLDDARIEREGRVGAMADQT